MAVAGFRPAEGGFRSLYTAPPGQLTAATGMDAISHCVETFCSPKYNPVADTIALDGLRRAWQALPRAVDRQDDIEARGEMMLASTEKQRFKQKKVAK